MSNKKRFLSIAGALAVIMMVAVLAHFRPQLLPSAMAAEEGHGEAGAHDDGHDEEEVIKLSKAEMDEFGIEIRTAGPGLLSLYTSLPGEIAVNADRLAHIVPRVSGVVRDVRKRLGDHVTRGEVMAVLDSRELADAKAAFLAAKERRGLEQARFDREKALWEKKITSEQEYLEAKQALAEADIELRSAEQKLHALGLSEGDLAGMPEHPDSTFTMYEMVAPFSGTVIEKHITLGEVLKDDTEAYVIADLGTVWVNLSVYQKDLPLVKKGQPVVISAGYGIPDITGEISYIGPIVGEQTRTALARVVLPNKEGLFRPGLFINARVTVDQQSVPLLVPKTAVQTIDNNPVVFSVDEDGFEPRRVIVGRSDAGSIEIVSGIGPGERYVAKGAFTLKAQLAKGTFESGHSH